MMRMSASLLALGLLTGCSVFSTSNPAPPPPDFTQRTGADRQAPAAGIANRGKAQHDADDPALDESRGQPIGSIVPRDQSSKKPPPAAPAPM
jgi:hypothetical protein